MLGINTDGGSEKYANIGKTCVQQLSGLGKRAKTFQRFIFISDNCQVLSISGIVPLINLKKC